MDSIQLRIEHIRNRVVQAALRVGRAEDDVHILAATKTRSAEEINGAIEVGVHFIGENRVQEALPKLDELLPVQKHFIGHLQTNKAKAAVAHFDCIESIDRFKLAQAIDRHAATLGVQMPVLIEVNVADEASKPGAPLGEALALVKRVGALEHVQVQGLMAMPPFYEDPEAVRPYFQTMAALYNECRGFSFVTARHLSMGTSQDYEVAAEEGATLIRVGTALFGPRPARERT